MSTPPAKDSFIYAFWSEEGSSEKPGWYLAKVLSIAVDGVARLRYRSGGLFETVQFSSIKWAPAKGNGKWFLPPGSLIPSLPIVEASYSKEHKVKGFADDLTILSRTPTDHQDVLTSIDYRCKEICLCISPDKCFSLIFDGKNTKATSSFKVGGSVTKNISDNPTSFLGGAQQFAEIRRKRRSLQVRFF